MAIFGFFVFFPEAMAIELPGSFQRSCASAPHLELSLWVASMVPGYAHVVLLVISLLW